MNKPYDYENNNNNRQKPKIQSTISPIQVREESIAAVLTIERIR